MWELDENRMQREFSVPFAQVRENLRKVFEEYGVSNTKQNTWLETEDFYWELLDDNGQLTERGRATMEKWKDHFGDPLKEMDFAMYMID